MKKLFLCLLIVVLSVNMNAQEMGKIRGGLDLGLAFPNAGLGFSSDLETV